MPITVWTADRPLLDCETRAFLNPAHVVGAPPPKPPSADDCDESEPVGMIRYAGSIEGMQTEARVYSQGFSLGSIPPGRVDDCTLRAEIARLHAELAKFKFDADPPAVTSGKAPIPLRALQYRVQAIGLFSR